MNDIRFTAAWLATVLLLPTAPAGAQERPTPLRYLRPSEGKLVLESEVTETRTDGQTVYTSTTERGDEKTTLTVAYERPGKPVRAEVVVEGPKGRRTAEVTFDKQGVRLKRGGGITDFLKVGADPVVTTAPDWSDIFQLARRYDRTKGGRQEFPGLWVHPVQPPIVQTFAIERIGTDVITAGDQKVTLDRYRIKLRSGDYIAWADANGRVYKLFRSGSPRAFVVLEGFEEAARTLGP
jgi:hypothetical protein